MPEPIVYIDHSTVRPGQLDALKRAMRELVDFIEANEPQLLSYAVYLSDDASRVTVVHVHRDSASLARHMGVAGPAFPKFADLVQLSAIDVHGAVDEALLEKLRDKARLLGSGEVRVHPPLAGFVRA